MLIFIWIPAILIVFALLTGQSFGLKRSMFGSSHYGVVERDESPVDYWINVIMYFGVIGFILYKEFLP